MCLCCASKIEYSLPSSSTDLHPVIPGNVFIKYADDVFLTAPSSNSLGLPYTIATHTNTYNYTDKAFKTIICSLCYNAHNHHNVDDAFEPIIFRQGHLISLMITSQF